MNVAGNRAFKLYEDGRVRRLPLARVYGVEDGDFIVTLAGYSRTCTCQNPRKCSHVEAAEMLMADETRREAFDKCDSCDSCELRPVEHVDHARRLCDQCAQAAWQEAKQA